jgi:hypothetical protein
MVMLPILIFPSESPTAASQRTYLAFVLSEFRTGHPFELSQRGGRKLFNRGNGGDVSKNLRELRKGGWLLAQQVGKTEGFCYSPGKKLGPNSALYEEWQAFATSLFGKQGLVSKFVNSAVWGHGVFGFKQTLVLGAIVYRKQQFRRVDLVDYFQNLMSESTIDSALKKMIETKIVTYVDGFYIRNQYWEAHLKIFVDGHPGGKARQVRIRREVTIDRRRYSNLLRDGKLTPRVRKDLLRNPCVRCGRKSKEVEHFPAVKFGGKDHPHLVWAICQGCNARTKAFIKKIDSFEIRPGKLHVVNRDIDPNDLLRASLSTGLGKFYKAADMRDYAEGRRIIEKACSLVQFLEVNGLLQKRRKTKPKPSPGVRRIKGKRPTINESSRLKY